MLQLNLRPKAKLVSKTEIIFTFSHTKAYMTQIDLAINWVKVNPGPNLNNIGRTRLPNVTHQVSRQSAIWFWRRRFFKVFTIYGCGSHVGHGDPHHLNNFLFLKALEAVYEIWLQSTQWFQRRSCLKLWTDDGGCLCYKLPRSLRLR